ncbi:MAG TPA: hypothetical protein VGU74_10770 [Gemmatimonadales bacterium]|nr:hypothetical protein [Gemmatimonadales bacterium]
MASKELLDRANRGEMCVCGKRIWVEVKSVPETKPGMVGDTVWNVDSQVRHASPACAWFTLELAKRE